MANRKSDRQSDHDAAVAGLASVYRDKGFSQWSNPNGEKNKDFDGRYPDVIVKSKDGDGYYLFEIETDDSVSEDEASSQWKDYDSTWSCWYLGVPVDNEGEAKRLCQKHGIKNCRIKTWRQNQDGTHTFWGLPGL